MTDTPLPEEKPESASPKKSKSTMTSDMSQLEGAKVDHSNPLAKISGLSLDPDAPPPPPKPDPPPEPTPEPKPTPEPEPTPPLKPEPTPPLKPAPALEPTPEPPPIEEPAPGAASMPIAPPAEDPSVLPPPKNIGSDEEPTLGDLRDEIAAEIAKTRTSIDVKLDDDELSKDEKPKARWGLRILALMVVGGFLAVAGTVAGFYIHIRRLESKAKGMDLFAAIENKDSDAVDFIIDWDPGQLRGTRELEEVIGGKRKRRTFTPLTLACAKGHAKIGWRLIKKGKAKPTVKDELDNAAIHYATRNGKVSCLKMLTRADVSLETRGQGRRTPLHMAVDYQQRKVLEWLLDKDADINGRDYAKATPLHHASELGYMEIAMDLVEAKAMIEAKDESGQTPLHYASTSDMVELMLEAGAKIDVEDGNGLTPLHVAAREGRIAVVKALLEAGANVNAKSDDRETPLDLAHRKVVHFLQSKGGRLGRDL